MKSFNIGNTAYFIEAWSGHVIRGKITEVYDDSVSIHCECYVDPEGNFKSKSYGTCGARFGKLYSTAQEAFAEKNRKHLEIISKYSNEIKDVPSLLKFALEHCVTGEEYTDYEAREVYIKKAKELLNIDLEHDTELELD